MGNGTKPISYGRCQLLPKSMPTLKKYSSSNQKTGYFVRANVGGSHPVTLQTTGVSERIFRDNGYSDGSTVPTKLVWSMYDVDLLYIESSLSSSTPSHSFDSLSDAVNGSNLTESTRHELIKYFRSYSGFHQEAVSKILDDLRRAISTEIMETYDASKPIESAKSFFAKFSEHPTDDIDTLLEEQKPETRSSLLSFAQRAPQLEEIEITGRSIIAYHLLPLSVPGTATVYDLTVSDEVSENHDYRIEYQNGPVLSLYIRGGRILKVNGPKDDLSSLEARHLTEEVTPVNIDDRDVRSTVDSPPVSAVDIPGKSFVQDNNDLYVGVVDRISNNGNPLVELENGHLLLDAGEKGGLYLIHRVEPKWGRVLCELTQAQA